MFCSLKFVPVGQKNPFRQNMNLPLVLPRGQILRDLTDVFHPPPPLWQPWPHPTLPSIITQKHQQTQKLINLTNNFNVPTNIYKSSKVMKQFTNSKAKKSIHRRTTSTNSWISFTFFLFVFLYRSNNIIKFNLLFVLLLRSEGVSLSLFILLLFALIG